jgi:transcriptional regulator with XRE-family HTH domain
MVQISQKALGHVLGITIRQVQKYEEGMNRISVGRLHQIARLFQVPVPFFFEGVPGGAACTPTGVSEFLATSDGSALARAFMRIPDAKLRQAIVGLVEDRAAETA